jgi:MerR family redox-sensitive transcriptional activator SoxR
MGFDWHASGLSVGQVASRMRLAPSAVRWYADHGLLPHERVAGNQRRFFADVLCRVAMIRAAQKVGLSLSDIRVALDELPPGRPPGREDWERLAAQLRATLTQRIDELFAVLDTLTTEQTDATSAREEHKQPGRGDPSAPRRAVQP